MGSSPASSCQARGWQAWGAAGPSSMPGGAVPDCLGDRLVPSVRPGQRVGELELGAVPGRPDRPVPGKHGTRSLRSQPHSCTSSQARYLNSSCHLPPTATLLPAAACMKRAAERHLTSGVIDNEHLTVKIDQNSAQSSFPPSHEYCRQRFHGGTGSAHT
jgi:hypothetical protein